MLASMALEIVLLLVLLIHSGQHVRRSFPGRDPGGPPGVRRLARLPQGRPHCPPDRELAGNGDRPGISAQPAIPQL